MPRVLEIAIRRADRLRVVSASSSFLATSHSVRPSDAPNPVHRSRCSCRRRSPTPPAEAIAGLADMLNGCERVTLLCGRGCEGAHDELLQVAEGAEGADRACQCAARSMSSGTNPYDVGITGLIGFLLRLLRQWAVATGC